MERLEEPSDPEIATALAREVDRVLVVSRRDQVALRLALVVHHFDPDADLLVTIFDDDVADHLRDLIDDVRVVSMAGLVAPAFAGPCLDSDLVAIVGGKDGVRAGASGPERVPATWPQTGALSRYRGNVGSLVRPFDRSARILVAGLAGVVALLLLDWVVTLIASDISAVEALYSVAKVIVTVGPSSAADEGQPWFQLFSVLVMLATLGFAAVLTAGLVNRLLDRRLTGIVGRRAVPRRDHVIVVGLGQVGLRLALLLREAGVPVVAIEPDETVRNVARARRLRLPVVIGNGSDQELLAGVSIDRARGLAAVTSDEIDNIAIAVAGRSLHEGLPTVLRAGDGDADSVTPSMANVGAVREVYRLAGVAIAESTLVEPVDAAFPIGDAVHFIRGGELV